MSNVNKHKNLSKYKILLFKFIKKLHTFTVADGVVLPDCVVAGELCDINKKYVIKVNH